jgi:DNA-binding SARP family transcriptional activator
VGLALAARAWPLARRLIDQHAEKLLAQGRRATLVEWCAALPDTELDGRLCYWLGVAHMADDAAAERWFARAWTDFSAQADFAGQVFTAARAVLSKTDSWRTHEGLSTWTGRLVELIEQDLGGLDENDVLLASAGMLRAVDFAPDYRTDSAAVRALVNRLLSRLASRGANGSVNLRLMASQTLMDHAGSTGNAEVFEQAVDAVGADLKAAGVTPWVLGIWLVTFGAVTSRYFSYTRRGFPYSSAEEALRAAIAIGESEPLPGVEFGALYHLQLLMKMRNDWSEFGALIERIARIADSRFTTQVAVAADCEAALHTKQRRFPEAYQDCERFMAAVEAANEPPIERWPHFITKYQVLLADRKPLVAAEFLEGLLPLFDGAIRKRTALCVCVARTLAAKWDGSAQYPHELRGCLHDMRDTGWSALLINQPELLAELVADGLEREIESDYCTTLIQRRRLLPPASRPAHGPWPLRLSLLGEFRIVRGNGPVPLSTKTPTRSLDLLRALATARNHACALAELYEWFWPDAEGDAAKAACEQALHRLRRLLGAPDPLSLREGKLRLLPDIVWIDLESWEAQLARAFAPQEQERAQGAMRKAFDGFTGPLFQAESPGAWSLPAIERVRSKFLELAERLARRCEAQRDFIGARAVYLRAIDMYPTSARGYEGLIRNRLALEDQAGALEDYQRYRRMLEAQGGQATPAIRALVDRLLRE